jgi:hypothetical protein
LELQELFGALGAVGALEAGGGTGLVGAFGAGAGGVCEAHGLSKINLREFSSAYHFNI